MDNHKNQWMALNSLTHGYKKLCFLLGGCLAASLALSAYLHTFDNLVVVKECQSSRRFLSKRESLDVQKAEIENFTKEFVRRAYQWEKTASPEAHFLNIKPFVTDGFFENATDRKYRLRGFPMENASQYVGNVKILVTRKKTVAQFDKIIRLNGLPFVSEAQVSLELVEGLPSEWNPRGIYVNRLAEYEQK